MSGHTPGPWDADGLIVSSVHPIPEPLALMALNGGRQGEALANARLIAAAPDLLKAAKRYLDRRGERDEADARIALDIIIAKAEGRS